MEWWKQLNDKIAKNTRLNQVSYSMIVSVAAAASGRCVVLSCTAGAVG